MSPLIAEYNRRRNSTYAPTRRGARELLLACLYEAGHWYAYAHFKVPVCLAYVNRRSSVGEGYVTPTHLLGLVPYKMIDEVEYIAFIAGPGVMIALAPLEDREITRVTSQRDIQIAKEILKRAHGDNHDGQKLLKANCISQTRRLIYQNWPIIEALAYELMIGGKLYIDACSKAERRYGIGHYFYATVGRLKSAKENLSVFHSSPEELVKALRAIT